MSVDPADYRVRGSSGKVQLAEAAAAGDLPSARFEATLGTQAFTGATYILWDRVVWDDIDFTSAYGDTYNQTGGMFWFPTAGEYAIEVYARLSPATAWTATTALLIIELGGSIDIQERMSTPAGPDIDPALIVMGTHRLIVDDIAQISVHLFGAESAGFISEASITITKKRAL